MFGSGVVAAHTYNILRVRAAQTAALGNPVRLKNVAAAPQGLAFPLALHYAENGTYSGPFSDVPQMGEPTEETVRYVVRWICEGESDAPIRAAAKDGLKALTVEFPEAVITQDGEQFSVSLLPVGEWPLTTVIEGGVFYRQLGVFLTAHVFRL